ncbi:hypothetical protein HWV07_02780 [Natronomonas salina]|uniref:hypothetical protein n=1 Tax=Natronomonas salina TaxID=1710540 RepID=UPI0015B522A2|nr:hypothetical protein [Natronomonas salina]QLD88019.1 hypothetical protein HWV07_02780 [Natronomonas salina]
MPSPPLRYSPRRLEHVVLGTIAGALLLFAAPVAAQQAPSATTPETGLSLTAQAITSAIFTVIVGGLMLALAPDYTERTTDRIVEDPGETFLFGLGIFVAAVIGIVLLAITGIGLLLAVPMLIAMAVIGVLGYIAFGRALVDDRGAALLIAVVISAFTAGVPILGGLVGFVLGCMAIGAWYLEYRSDGSRSSGRSRGVESVSGGASRGTTARTGDTDEWGSSWDDGSSSTANSDTDGTADDGWTTGFDDDADRN